MGVSKKIVVPQNGWFIMVPNPIKMDDLGLKEPYFWKHPYVYPPPPIFMFYPDINREELAAGDRQDSCHGFGNSSGVGISKDQEPHVTQLQGAKRNKGLEMDGYGWLNLLAELFGGVAFYVFFLNV